MTCEEFQMADLDLELIAAEGQLQQAAREHLLECPHCAALHDNWQVLRTDLHLLGAETQYVQVPARVELRLRQEFRTKHKTLKRRRVALIAAWALAGAAAVVCAITWFNWRLEQNQLVARNQTQSRQLVEVNSAASAHHVNPAGPELGEVLMASNDSTEFTLLPGAMPGSLEDATVVHVQMQRAALGALGLTVNEEHAMDWIQLDLLVGEDGQPQAVRLPESIN
jgi:predicted anti-sigma-YlaC factor YlaD